MNVSKFIGGVLFGMVTLAVVIWGSYHFYTYYNDPLQYEVVFEHDVPRALTGTGIAIRDEYLIENAPPGVESFLSDDAERVAAGQVIAEYHQFGSVGGDLRRLSEIDREISMLTGAQDTNVNNISAADAINRDIRDRLGVMASIAATGQSRELESVRGDLTSLINRRQIAIGRTASFSARIEELNRERTALEITDRGDAVQILAPAPGFFSKYYDGYESLITPAMMSSMSIADYIRLTERAPPAPAPVHVGRMVPTGIWYFAVPLDLHQGEWLRKGQQVQLEFDQVTRRVPATVYDLRLENNTEMMVAVFTSDHMSDDIINLRVGEVTIFSAQHTGLRIPTSALYFRILPDGARERGVYVLDGNTIRFRLIYPVYEEAAFLLSDPNPSVRITSDPDDPDTAPRRIPSPVRKYDLVITRGVDLYDGKTVQ